MPNVDQLIEDMRSDVDGDWFTRLCKSMANAPLVDEELLDRVGQPSRNTKLSPRETEILRWLSHGLLPKQAAEMMGITTNTAQTYLKNARFKLRAKTNAQACSHAVRQGFIQ